jgi:TonB family protein
MLALFVSVAFHAGLLGYINLPVSSERTPETIYVKLAQIDRIEESAGEPVFAPLPEETEKFLESPVYQPETPAVTDENPPEQGSDEITGSETGIAGGSTDGAGVGNGTVAADGSNGDGDVRVPDGRVESAAGETDTVESPETAPAPDLEAILSAYRERVKSEILAHREYPATARRLGREGEVRVQFVVEANGNVGSVEIVMSSGDASLDNAAMDAVQSASPVSPIPGELGVSSLAMSILIVFSLL